MASSSVPVEIASTIQAASIQRKPSPSHDINPSNAASIKQPVSMSLPPSPAEDDIDDEIPVSILRPAPRQTTLPPLPDLRFEQSYLKSIAHCDGKMGVLWITLRDQVILALAQGFALALLTAGWRHLNRGGAGKFSGRNVGSRIRRWWWGVNGWSIPDEVPDSREQLAREMSEFYVNKFSSAGSD